MLNRKSILLRVAAFYNAHSIEELLASGELACDCTRKQVPVFSELGFYLQDYSRERAACLPARYLTPSRIYLLVREELSHG